MHRYSPRGEGASDEENPSSYSQPTTRVEVSESHAPDAAGEAAGPLAVPSDDAVAAIHTGPYTPTNGVEATGPAGNALPAGESEGIVETEEPLNGDGRVEEDPHLTALRDAVGQGGNAPIASSQNASAALLREEMLTAPAEVVTRTQESFFVTYVRRLKGAGQTAPPFFAPTWDAIPSCVFTMIALMICTVIEAFGLQPYGLGLLSYLPSFGASCALVMCLLTSPGAQPRALVPSHITGAFLGVSWAHIMNSLPKPLSQQLALSFAVSMLTALMMLTGTLQPSASATTCLAALHLYGEMKDQGFMFLVTPATIGPCVVVFMGWLLNNLIPWRHCYPVWL